MQSVAPLAPALIPGPDADGFYHPIDEDQVAALVRMARQRGLQVRVRGSAHSEAAAIFSDARLRGAGEAVDLVLDLLDGVHFDAPRLQVSVAAGCRFGHDPRDRSGRATEARGLCAQLEARGWALPVLAGVSHQTVAGFFATGSCGGSLQHALDRAIVGLRLIDGTGQLHVLTPATTPALFAAAGVSLGLLGIVTGVTLQCEPRYDIIGEEAITTRSAAAVDLFADDGPRCLAAFLRAHAYARLLWWPQPGVDKLVVWTARREPGEPGEPRPYQAFPRVLGSDVVVQKLAGLGMRGLDAWHTAARAMPRPLRAATDPLRGALVNAFVPADAAGPRQFRDTWWRGLPMDDQIDERVMPVDFVEVWLPMAHAAEAMRRLRALHERTGWDLAVNAPIEVYAGAASRFSLSPGHGGDRVRINVFWPRFNREDPRAGSFAAHVAALADLGARFHWAKHVPASFGPAQAHAAYPEWPAFLHLRAALDPDQLFLTARWRHITGVAPAGAAGRPCRPLTLVTDPLSDHPARPRPFAISDAALAVGAATLLIFLAPDLLASAAGQLNVWCWALALVLGHLLIKHTLAFVRTPTTRPIEHWR